MAQIIGIHCVLAKYLHLNQYVFSCMRGKHVTYSWSVSGFVGVICAVCTLRAPSAAHVCAECALRAPLAARIPTKRELLINCVLHARLGSNTCPQHIWFDPARYLHLARSLFGSGVHPTTRMFRGSTRYLHQGRSPGISALGYTSPNPGTRAFDIENQEKRLFPTLN